jgi:hypothetical protein
MDEFFESVVWVISGNIGERMRDSKRRRSFQKGSGDMRWGGRGVVGVGEVGGRYNGLLDEVMEGL